MLITPPATMPIRRIQWQLRQPHQTNRSGWNGRRQVSTTPGAAMFSCSIEFAPVRTQAQAKKWRGFFASLNGQVNHFPVVAVEARQHAGASPTIVSGEAMANQVQLGGAIPGLVSGDYMTVKLADGTYQLVCLTAPILGGVATFMPPLRLDAATGPGSTETAVPFAHVTMASDTYNYDVQAGQIYGFAFSVEEYFG